MPCSIVLIQPNNNTATQFVTRLKNLTAIVIDYVIHQKKAVTNICAFFQKVAYRRKVDC